MHGVNSSPRSQLGTIQAAGFNGYCILKADAVNNAVETELQTGMLGNSCFSLTQLCSNMNIVGPKKWWKVSISQIIFLLSEWKSHWNQLSTTRWVYSSYSKSSGNKLSLKQELMSENTMNNQNKNKDNLIALHVNILILEPCIGPVLYITKWIYF